MARLYHLQGKRQPARRLFTQAFSGLAKIGDQYDMLWARFFMCQLELDEATDEKGMQKAYKIISETLKYAEKFGRQGVHNVFTLFLTAELNYLTGHWRN